MPNTNEKVKDVIREAMDFKKFRKGQSSCSTSSVSASCGRKEPSSENDSSQPHPQAAASNRAQFDIEEWLGGSKLKELRNKLKTDGIVYGKQRKQFVRVLTNHLHHKHVK